MELPWLARRAGRSLLLLFAASLLSFLLGRFAPGGFFADLRLNPQIAPSFVETLRHRYGVDRPAASQYVRWLGSTLKGDLGVSLAWRQPVAQILWPRARRTLAVTGCALLLAWSLGLPWGMLAAARRRSPCDIAGSVLSLLLTAAPEVLLTLIGVYVAFRLGRTCAIGGMLLPVILVAAGAFPAVFLHARGAVEQTLDAAFVRSARAHGIRGPRLWTRYILPAAANPMISLFGLSLGALAGASLVVEAVLGGPGLGPLFLDAIAARDLDIVTAIVLLSACFLIAGNLLTDLLLALNDPRIRMARE
ncbi:MAG: ABC transporter permease [Acidobacteriota bacterium]|nr:ABC transporter permease [Acidobacteriota bacterium]